MTHSILAGTTAHRAPEAAGTQVFGRIETVEPVGEGTRIEIRRPDGALLIASVHAESVETSMNTSMAGRNIWVSGQMQDNLLVVAMFTVYSEEP